MIQTIKLGDRHWAIGMRWRTYEASPVRRELILEADDLDAQVMARRISHELRQVGFGAVDPGAALPKRLYSLAAAVAAAHAQPWLGIFRLGDDLWWYIAVRDGHAILPDGDVVGSEAEILAARQRHQSFPDWQFVEGNAADLTALLAGQGRKLALHRVLPCRTTLPLLQIAAAVAGLGVVGGGAWFWHHHQVVLQAERAARLAAYRAKMRASQVVQSPLQALPGVAAWMDACGTIISRHGLLYEGWAVARVDCADGKVTFRWARGPGATASLRPPGDLAQSGDAVVETISLPKLAPGQNDATSFAIANAALYGLIQSLGAQGQIRAATNPAGLPGAPAAAGGRGIASEQVQIETRFPPFSVDWSSVSGFRVQALTTSALADGMQDDPSPSWQMTGVIYER